MSDIFGSPEVTRRILSGMTAALAVLCAASCQSLGQYQKITEVIDLSKGRFATPHLQAPAYFPITLVFVNDGPEKVSISSRDLNIRELVVGKTETLTQVTMASVDIGALAPGSYTLTCACDAGEQDAVISVRSRLR